MMGGLWPFRNLWLKVLSVGLAVLLWLVIAGEGTVERGLQVPLELLQFPQGLELVGDAPTQVDVRLRGASRALSRISTSDVVAALDLSGAVAGQRLYQLTPEQVRVPFGVEVTQVTPATIAFVFEPSITREVTVSATVEGTPAAGYMVQSISSEPARVEIVGPESSVAYIDAAVTETISVEGADETVRQTVTLGLADPALRLKIPQSATVTVEILPVQVTRRLTDQAVELRGLPDGLIALVVPPTVDVELEEGEGGAGAPRFDAVTLFVDLAELGVGEYTMEIRTDSTIGPGIALIEPSHVQVHVSRVDD